MLDIMKILNKRKSIGHEGMNGLSQVDKDNLSDDTVILCTDHVYYGDRHDESKFYAFEQFTPKSIEL